MEQPGLELALQVGALTQDLSISACFIQEAGSLGWDGRAVVARPFSEFFADGGSWGPRCAQ